jgi:hypothetical protein
MPIISVFYGLIIRMYFADHAPPHFHVEYGEFKAIISIDNFTVIEGFLPRRALNLTLDWAELHKSELMLDWELCQKNQQPFKIEPLL